MLPSLSGAQATTNFNKWKPENDNSILANGLVSNSDYYKDIGKNYYISYFSAFSFDINDINYENFNTLSGKNWLSNFVDIFNSSKNCQVVSVPQATSIFLYGNDEKCNYIDI